MKMKYGFIIAIASVLFISHLAGAFPGSNEKPVTPYGDSCKRCSEYGNCKSTMSHEDAQKALIEYYHDKGLGVELEKKRGRFIRAKVTDNKKVVDVIIFDRRSGRIRSIY
ncbi:MAG: hypothetical protein AMK71_13190 [Nitrospira bacterium SG8_35_4]|nr:MAG: hypothetical protein AMK71_13190 [Nitrospira bacterium SG8_35_4]